jgi:hypothetical protein
MNDFGSSKPIMNDRSCPHFNIGRYCASFDPSAYATPRLESDVRADNNGAETMLGHCTHGRTRFNANVTDQQFHTQTIRHDAQLKWSAPSTRKLKLSAASTFAGRLRRVTTMRFP